MTKIHVTFADETPSNIVVHTKLAYEVQPVNEIKISDKL